MGEPVQMTASNREKNTWEMTAKIGMFKHEEFRFVRDKDKNQAIYPARQRASETDNTKTWWTWTQAGINAIADNAGEFGNPKPSDRFDQKHFNSFKEREATKGLDRQDLAEMGLIKGDSTQTVPICGPDHKGANKFWMIDGKFGDLVKITLQVKNGVIDMTTNSAAHGMRAWTSRGLLQRRKYYVTSSWNDWGFTEMIQQPDPKGKSSIYIMKAKMDMSAM